MKKRTKRKVRPLLNPLHLAMTRVRGLSDGVLCDLRLMELSSIDAIATGIGDQKDISMLSGMAKLSEMMAGQGIGVEGLQVAIDAQVAIESIVERQNRLGKVGASMAELDALRSAFEVHDAQRQMLSHGEYEKFLKNVINKHDGSLLHNH